MDPEIDAGPDYLAPGSVEEAVALLGKHGDEAKLVAGGQSLFVFLRQGLLQPGYLIGLKRIPELTRLEVAPDGGLTIGAMVTQYTLETSPLVRERFPILADAAAVIASPPIRRQGTIGGNLCHADPTGDPPAALIALGAEVEVVRANRQRRVPVAELFADYMETTLESDELLTAVHVPAPAPHTGAAYQKHRMRGVDTALVGAGVRLTLADDGQTCRDVGIGLVGAGATPLRAVAAEAALCGRAVTDDTLREAADVAAVNCAPLSDTEGSEWYRREMIAVFVRRAGDIARRRARGA